MKDSQPEVNRADVTRRQFVRTTGLGVVGASVVACAPATRIVVIGGNRSALRLLVRPYRPCDRGRGPHSTLRSRGQT